MPLFYFLELKRENKKLSQSSSIQNEPYLDLPKPITQTYHQFSSYDIKIFFQLNDSLFLTLKAKGEL